MKLELPRLGHRVTVCPDGTTAVAALDKNTYDCILVDLDMPGCDGIGVIAHCKETSPETEAVVLTGKSSMETADRRTASWGLRLSHQAVQAGRNASAVETRV